MTSPGADGGSQLRTRVESSGDIDEKLLTGEDSRKTVKLTCMYVIVISWARGLYQIYYTVAQGPKAQCNKSIQTSCP